MNSLLRPALSIFVLLSLVTGLVYPVLVTLVAKAAFPEQASGSLIEVKGQAVGSSLIGQPFSDNGHFWSRPSATAPNPYNASASGASNLSATNPALIENVKSRIDTLHAADPGLASPIPADLVTSSASGLDPDISPQGAYAQVARVAKARGMTIDRLRAIVDTHVEKRQFGFLGEPRVNVLELNLALDAGAK